MFFRLFFQKRLLSWSSLGAATATAYLHLHLECHTCVVQVLHASIVSCSSRRRPRSIRRCSSMEPPIDLRFQHPKGLHNISMSRGSRRRYQTHLNFEHCGRMLPDECWRKHECSQENIDASRRRKESSRRYEHYIEHYTQHTH